MRDIEAINKRLACKADCEGCSDYQNCEESFDNFCDDVLAYTSLLEGISLDRLEQICAAEKDGRCVVLNEKPMPTVRGNDEYDTDAYCPYCGETVSGYWGIDDSVPEICQCPNCGGYINTYAISITRAEAEKALGKEQGHDD